MLFFLVSLAPFEDADTSHRVGYIVPLQLCYEKDMMLVTQQIANKSGIVHTCVQINHDNIYLFIMQSVLPSSTNLLDLTTAP